MYVHTVSLLKVLYVPMFILYVLMICLRVSLCTMCMSGALRVQKRASDPLELWSETAETVAIYCVSSENGAQVFGRAANVPNQGATSPPLWFPSSTAKQSRRGARRQENRETRKPKGEKETEL